MVSLKCKHVFLLRRSLFESCLARLTSCHEARVEASSGTGYTLKQASRFQGDNFSSCRRYTLKSCAACWEDLGGTKLAYRIAVDGCQDIVNTRSEKPPCNVTETFVGWSSFEEAPTEPVFQPEPFSAIELSRLGSVVYVYVWVCSFLLRAIPA
jgi:hypothetical protein